MQILDIGNRIHDTAGTQHIGVFCVERPRHDARLVFALLEMRVGKTEEDFTELVFLKKVGEEFHRVGADAGCVLVGIC